MGIRKIVHINEEKCDGCGVCVPDCAEGAIQIINGKAKLLRDDLCDGLGNCLGACPQDAITIIEREAKDFDEEAVEKHLQAQKQPKAPIPMHMGGGCPGSRMMEIKREEQTGESTLVSSADVEIHIKPQLKQWPVQLHLVPVKAPYFKNADLLISADCVPMAYADYHLDLLKNRAVAIGCPKLDNVMEYVDKLTEMIKENDFKSITIAYMEVPCCGGIVRAVEQAVEKAGKSVSVQKVRIGIDGKKK